MSKSLFNDDKNKEEVVASFLDKYFYDVLSREGKIKGWLRVGGKLLQKEGQDVIFVTPSDKKIIADEKAASHYSNKIIGTFAFELKNRTSGNIGWFINDELKTEYYVLCWPLLKEDRKGYDKSDFQYIEVMIISKKGVWKVINDNDLTRDNIIEEMDKHNQTVKADDDPIILKDGIKLYYNFSLEEKPINLVIDKTLLVKKAIFHGYIKRMICEKCNSLMRFKVNPKNMFKYYKCTNEECGFYKEKEEWELDKTSQFFK